MSAPTPVTNRAMVMDSGIGQKADVHGQLPGRHPLEQGDHRLPLIPLVAHQPDEHQQRGHERAAHHGGGQPAGPRLAQAAAQRHQDQYPGQREGGDQPDQINERAHDSTPALSLQHR